MTQDDLTPWQDTPLVQALTAPASASELADQGAALAAFQATTGRAGRRGAVRWLGTGMTSIALLGVVGSGVAAAAYTKSLPDSVQSFFHDVLGPIGVPAPVSEGSHQPHAHRHPLAGKPGPRLTPVVAVPSGAAGRTASPTPASGIGGQSTKAPAGSTGGGTQPAVGGRQPGPATSPTPQVSQPPPSPTPTPTPTGPAGDPSTWSVSGGISQHVVQVHHGVQVSGTLLDAAGQPVSGHQVFVRTHLAGTSGWQRVAVRRTASDGTMRFWLAGLTRNESVILGAGHNVHTAAMSVVVLPVLSVSVAQTADGTGYVVTVSADGGTPGDTLNLLKNTPQGWRKIGQGSLDGSAQVSFAIPAPKQKHRFMVQLPATRQHGFDRQQFTLTPLP